MYLNYNYITYGILLTIGIVWVICGDSIKEGLFSASQRDIRLIVFIILAIIGTLIYGGIFWW